MAVLEYAVDGPVAILTLNRPEKRNAVNRDLALAIEGAIDRLEADPTIHVGIVRAHTNHGSRPVFCAGHDLSGPTEIGDDGTATSRGGFAGITDRVREKPLIACVDGLATGGGCEVALACDIIIGSERASFALPEVRWNLLAGGGGMFRLPRVVGRPVAMDVMLTGSELSAERAYSLGLISRLVPSADVDAVALDCARQIAAMGSTAVRLTRTIVAAAEHIDDELGWRMTMDAAGVVLSDPALASGLAAFAHRKGY